MSVSAQSTHGRTVGWQRAENAVVAVGVLITVLVLGQPWWMLLAAFLLFDLSALGYLINQRAGAFGYNLVHNYTAPAALVIGWGGLQLAGLEVGWVLLLACCWGFHVAVDRALGYGLKLGSFRQTHLGTIGAAESASAPLQRA